MASKFKTKTWIIVGVVGIGLLFVGWPMIKGIFSGLGSDSGSASSLQIGGDRW